jgi:DNA-binding XRE family transcriptional regulator
MQMTLNLPIAATRATVREYRLRAGLSQAAAAQLVQLRDKSRWSEYERGVETIDAARWELFLLLTGQHPHWAPLTPR